MKNEVIAVIPARMNSRRFSGKVLYPYRGKPLLFYVWNEVIKAGTIDRLIIATDQLEIKKAAEEFGAEVVMTSKRHRTGSDRVAEVIGKTGGEIIINIQADNFGLTGAVLDRVVREMRREKKLGYATLAFRIEEDNRLFDPNLVKVAVGQDGRALWFSRYPLPYLQHAEEKDRARQFKFWGHIGVYFYRRQALEAYAGWKRTPHEKAESLEQLRILENGGLMKVFVTKNRVVSVDAPADLKELDLLYR
ncbi:MAG: 3-deoxy-manno-octulosonate cytidylyltransferase [Candidatus Zixiibacteriota bacterium]